MRITILIGAFFLLCTCDRATNTEASLNTSASLIGAAAIQNTPVDTSAKILSKRFVPPAGFVRQLAPEGSFARYLQELPLKPHGSLVHYFDGRVKRRSSVHAAVVDLDVGKRDLQQCADAIMRLRGEYLFHKNDFDNLSFNFTNGFPAEFSKWAAGQRIKVSGNDVNWYAGGRKDHSYQNFRKYMDMVFAYAGTLSLEKELVSIPLDSLAIGDVFIQGGSPGHAIIVVDLLTHESSEEKLFLLAQSYMPAQEIHILQNPRDKNRSPWYSTQIQGRLVTPEWIFDFSDLKRFE
ncbi:MAG: DUF4846 domain-containing protein [Saprospiraceae bacterium]